MRRKKSPRNTTEECSRHPESFLLDAMVLGTSNAIEAQESVGQNEFVRSETLPTKMQRYFGGPDPKAVLEAAGVKFLGPVEGDDAFQYVELPPGWEKMPSEHPMWSHLLDDKGRERAAIFYKAAFYDRSSHLSLNCRYSVRQDFEEQRNNGVAVAQVRDGQAVIYSTEPVKLPKEHDQKFFELGELSVKKATEWLKAKFPEWENPGAYWD